ncbi:hypothetical protein ACN28E_29790 [Archangium lansingense]|uniref:hypothetical protein n=1 Tax=Archangium lansingense TaxID=2995310 RepID=UPI003B81D579
MTPRWLVCLVLGLAAPAAHAQTAPVAAPELGYTEEADADLDPLAPSPPPALPLERPTARPFADSVWTSGHWYWDGNEWRFKPGAWVARMPGYQFVNGYWQQEGEDVWRWISGGWARPGSTDVEIPIDVSSEEVATSQAPPQLQVETPPPAPAQNLTWAPGYWYWSGNQYVWVDGSWVAPPQPNLVFIAPKWSRRGHSWVFIEGGWAPRGSVRIVVPEYRHARISVGWEHPNYFFHTWRRYPMMRHHEWNRPWGWGRYREYRSRPWGRHDGSRYHDASPYRGHDRGDHRGGHRGGRGGGRGDGHRDGRHHR